MFLDSNGAPLLVVPVAVVDGWERSAPGAVEIRRLAWGWLADRHEDLPPALVRVDARDAPASSGVSARTIQRTVAVRFG
ncbi:MAG TPA: hypothetical protein VHV29_16460 [Terriglobales bacterium]|nr:hypothetical protein [Terriglobales bacterium]